MLLVKPIYLNYAHSRHLHGPAAHINSGGNATHLSNSHVSHDVMEGKLIPGRND